MRTPRLLSAVVGLLLSGAFIGSAQGAVTLTRTSSPIFYTDFGDGLTSMYVAYQVTNTGPTNYGSVYVTASNFTGGIVTLAVNENGVHALGALAVGQTKTAFFYLTASSNTLAAQAHTITVLDGPVGIGNSLLAQNFSFSSVSDTIAANANKVNTTVYGPNPPGIGGIVTVTVTGNTGTIGGSQVGSFNPASFTNWRADAFQLVSTTITLSGGNTGVYDDILLLPPAAFASSSDTAYVAVYRFRAVAITNTSTPVSPVGYISSGANVKHTTTSNFAALAPITPASNSVVLAKTVDQSTLLAPATVTYTVRFTNSSPMIDTFYDRIVDSLPSTPANATFVPGSTTFHGVAMPDPNLTGQVATWFGTFAVPAGTTRDLVYQVAIPAAGGAYVNSARAYVENTQIDTTANTSDNAPATATVTLTPLALSGTVFEDVNYGGGAGRNLATSGGVPRSGARVELYDASGNFLRFKTTDASGIYTFDFVSPGAHTIRVVNGSVTSSRAAAAPGLIPVQTFRTDGSTEAAVEVTDRVGGETPSLADAANGSTTLAALTTATTTAQSITAVTISASSVSGLDFGFNFDTIVNVNDAGQGSLRQFILNSNALTGADTTVFMISDGAAHPGLRAGLANLLTGGVALIAPTTELPPITDAGTTIDGSTQTTNVGNTNAVTLGAGGTVGVDNLPLPTVPGPEVELRDNGALDTGLRVQAANATIRGLSINGFGNTPNNNNHGNILLNSSATGVLIEQNIIGTSATSFTDPGAAARSGGDNIRAVAALTGTIRNNLVGFTTGKGIELVNGANGWTVSGNELRGNGIGNPNLDGIDVENGSGSANITGNLSINNHAVGIDTYQSTGGNTIANNTVTNNGLGAGANEEEMGIRIFGANNTVSRNIVSQSSVAGIAVTAAASQTVITRNSLFSNGAIGIDLHTASDNIRTGTPPYVTPNDNGDGDTGGNGLLNFPIVTEATIVGGNLVLKGFARPGAVIEFFLAAPLAAGFGEGQTWLVTLTEGSAADTDGSTGTYTNPVNGLNQGTDTTNRFTFTIPIPGGVALGSTLTATATLAGATSEFSGNVVVTNPILISGTIFEDVNGDSNLGDASGRPSVGLRLYHDVNANGLVDAGDTFIAATTTDAAGAYSFTVTAATPYLVAVDSKSLAPTAGFNGGFAQDNVWAEQTYGDDPATPALDLGARFGGRNATVSDNYNSADPAPASNAYEHLARVAITTTSVVDVDFAFSFNAVTNLRAGDAADDDASAARTVQGSLRQFVANANAITGANAMRFVPVVPVNAPSWWRLSLTTLLPAVTDAATTIDGRAYSSADGVTVRDDNPGALGVGGTVGVDALPLSTVARPELELAATGANGLDVRASGFILRRVALNGANNGIAIANAITGIVIEENFIGTTAGSFADPGAAARTGFGIFGSGGDSGLVRNNLIGFTNQDGIHLGAASDNWLIQDNEVRNTGLNIAALADGIWLYGSTGTQVVGNLITAGYDANIDGPGAGLSAQVVNNTVTDTGLLDGIRNNGTGSLISKNIVTGTPRYGVVAAVNATVSENRISANGTAIQVNGAGNAITANEIFANTVAAIRVNASNQNRISQNITYGNAGPGIDLGAAGVSPNDGATGATANIGMDYPIFTAGRLNGANLTVTGFVGNAPGQSAFGGATIEVFKADNAPADQNGPIIVGDGLDVAHGEGRTYLGTVVAAADGTFNGTLAVSGLAIGEIITATATDASGNTSEFSANFVVTPPGVDVSGNVYEDANLNVQQDAGETGTSLALYVKLLDPISPAGPALAAATVDPVTGAYTLPFVLAGTHTLILDDNNTLADITPTIPAGWTGTESGDGRRTPVAVADVSVPNQNFGLNRGLLISGRVFTDNGAGGGTPNDGLPNGSEEGLDGVALQLTDNTGATVHSTATSNATGEYVLAIPASIPAGSALRIVQTNANGFLSTGAALGNTGGVYDRASDTISFTLAANTAYTGVHFGDVAPNNFNTDGAQAGLPGTTLVYAHTYVAATAGSVAFSAANTQSPAFPGWTSTLYRDTNANGQLDAGEPAITGPLALGTGETLTLLVKQFIPVNAPFGATNDTTVTATFTYTGAPSPVLTAELIRHDITTVGNPTTAGLRLNKTVDKPSALPGETITYTITYTNQSSDELRNVVIHDTTPAFTTFVSGANGPLPNDLTGVVLTAPAVNATGPIRWTFTGTLAPGGTGTVSFTVRLDQ